MPVSDFIRACREGSLDEIRSECARRGSIHDGEFRLGLLNALSSGRWESAKFLLSETEEGRSYDLTKGDYEVVRATLLSRFPEGRLGMADFLARRDESLLSVPDFSVELAELIAARRNPDGFDMVDFDESVRRTEEAKAAGLADASNLIARFGIRKTRDMAATVDKSPQLSKAFEVRRLNESLQVKSEIGSGGKTRKI